MASITVTITGVWNAADLGIGTGVRSVDPRLNLQAIDGLLIGLMSGAYSGTYDVITSSTNAVKASGTLTISSGSGSVGGTIGGTAKTVTWGTSDTASAAALAAAINADATISKLVTATSVAGVVTLTANLPGPLGNKITLVASGTGVTASAGTLTSGAGSDGQPTSFSLA